ncbi:hypothetical protein [Burkholderia contaminans]|uniref:hypothetical protein n=1 Tax=Burkholderia contaminans TaxID=488447 RepID=UPI00158F3A37|nr:hypothetical protein [Burkholderia contaminans]
MTTNNELTIKELANMNLVFGFGNVAYLDANRTIKYQNSIRFEDLGKSRDFFIERAKYLSVYGGANRMDCGYLMAEELKLDLELAKQIILLYSNYYFYFSSKVRRDKEVIKMMLAHYEACHSDATHILLRENRLGVAYEIIKEFPEYEKCLGETLKKKIGSMSLVEYVERRSLQKSLKKDLKKKEKPVMRTKI